MSDHLARRGFLRGLASLPLIGGGVAIIGNPVAPAEAASFELLRSYNAWLIQERRHLLEEMHGSGADYFEPNTPGGMWHWRAYGEPPVAPPSTRAAVVLSSVGVPLT